MDGVNGESSEAQKRLLIAKRGFLKGHLTRFENFVGDATNYNRLIELSERSSKIEKIFDDFNDIQSTIELIDSSDSQLRERDEFENRYFSAISIAKGIIKDQEDQRRSASNVHTVLHASEGSVQSTAQMSYQLPPISLPQFDGSYDKWSTFYDTYVSLIHNNTSLVPVQKFHYLQSVLKGEASKIIDSLEINEQNYLVAIDLLVKRFESKKHAIRNHIKNIFELQSVTRESHSSLRAFLDTFQKHYRCLLNLGEPINSCCSVLIYLLLSKLDSSTKREWEIQTKDVVSPNVDSFIKFLTDRCLILESIDTKYSDLNTSKKFNSSKLVHVLTNNYFCVFCKSHDHGITYCKHFLKLDISSRLNQARDLGLCTNCLRRGHNNRSCTHNRFCQQCGKKHHSLLHLVNTNNSSKNKTSSHRLSLDVTPDPNLSISENQNQQQPSSVSCCQNIKSESAVVNCTQKGCNSYTILSTAQVYIYDSNNQPILCRALLDSASQSNFMSLDLFKSLKLNPHKINMPIIGINAVTSRINQAVKTKIHSSVNNNSFNLTFLIIGKITDDLPQQTIDPSSLNVPCDIKLADPEFYCSSRIDILIGGSIFYELLLPNQIRLGPGKPILQSTKLGFVVGGNICPNFIPENYVCNFVRNSETKDLESQLEAFWQIEECISKECVYTKEELECENHFASTYERSENGQFIVKLPLKDNFNQLGDSLNVAISRFQSLERKLSRNSEIKLQYCAFMREYENMKHMSQINSDLDLVSSNQILYLPHHSVIKESSLTTKLRVVFDASSKTSSGISLNDVLMVGPCIQQPIFCILLRFRKHAIAFTADVSKMYRCILLHESQRDYQRILWRSEASQELKHYRLNTLTYGTSPASFIATRCLKQLSIDYQNEFPESSRSMAEDFYMDDWLSGTDNIENALSLIKNTKDILSSANFHLRQWTSNDPRVLEFLGNSKSSFNNQYFVKDNQNSKTLGIFWNSSSDEFKYSVKLTNTYVTFSKRLILSVISQIYDILGLLGPVIIKAKIILQKLWLAKIDWDAPVPESILESWLGFYKQLPELNKVRISRHILCLQPKQIQIHCFSDASTQGYGAAIYLRSVNYNNDIVVHLACAKSRVAPLKSLSLPRLELCGVVLAVELCQTLKFSLGHDIQKVFYWTDSQIVLAWLRREPSSLKTFVSNRIAKVQRRSKIEQWFHVPTEENPADLISRGLDPSEIINNSFWFNGPPFLSRDTSFWPKGCNKDFELNDLPEVKISNVNLICTNKMSDFILRYSSYNKLLRVTAWIIRFKNNCLLPLHSRNFGSLTISEMEQALVVLVKLVQYEVFHREIDLLRKSEPISSKSSLLSLDPYLDKNEVLLLGGRLKHSHLSYASKHPVILPSKHHFTHLLILNEHHKNLHAGTQLILSTLRLRFWPLRGRQTVRNVLRKCITCFKVSPVKIEQKMADLPASRITPSVRAFITCGVDYAGPYSIKDSKFRNKKMLNSYLCIFVCFSTKAVHIEVVSELSTEGFLNAFKRFISRRGLCSDIYSDCGTNFVGADRLLTEFSNHANDSKFKDFLLENKITWHFSPPRSPHFGGLWESAVRLAKYHLKRIMQNVAFNYEDFYSICVQVESILNSRPLYPLTEEPEDYEVITPGHFLIGGSLKSLPELPLWDSRQSHASRYKQIRFLIQQFWDHWSKDYLSTLQQRSKWRTQITNKLVVGSLVLLHEENVPPMCWKMGRIIDLHPGSDGLVRVVSIRTKDSVFKRSITKISLLPIETPKQDNYVESKDVSMVAACSV